MRVDGGSYDFVCGLKYNMVFQVMWIYPVILDDDCVEFTMSSMTGACLRMLISIHEFFEESSFYVLWVRRSLTCERWIVNFNTLDGLKNCMKLDELCLLILCLFFYLC